MAEEKTEHIAFSGTDLINAVKAVAKDPLLEVENGKHRLGQRSKWPQRHFILLADGNELIDPDQKYQRLTIQRHSWPWVMYAVRYSDSDIAKALEEFSSNLLGQLKPSVE